MAKSILGNEDEYFVPLQDQRIFGAGIKRKCVDFVPAQTSVGLTKADKSVHALGDHYLSIVLKDEKSSANGSEAVPDGSSKRLELGVGESVCPSCNLPVWNDSHSQGGNPPTGVSRLSRGAHERSVAHQLCLEHVYPPSSVDRSRLGLRYLSSFGWDPNSRQGLGARGEGLLAPVKSKVKNNTVGIGADSTILRKRNKSGEEGSIQTSQKNKNKLGAGQTRRMALEERQKEEILRNVIWGDDRIKKFLGPN